MDIPTDLEEGILQIFYYDEGGRIVIPEHADQRLEIFFTMMDELEQPPLRSAGISQTSLPFGVPGKAQEEAPQAPAPEDAVRLAETAQLRQDINQREEELLTINRLQSFMGNMLGNIAGLQDAATRNSKVQVSTSVENLNLMVTQGNKVLQSQLDLIELARKRISDLQTPPPPPPSTDFGDLVKSAYPYLRDVLVTTMQLRGPKDGGEPRALPVGEDKKASPRTPAAQPAAPATPPGDGLTQDEMLGALGILKQYVAPEKLASMLTNRAEFLTFVDALAQQSRHKGMGAEREQALVPSAAKVPPAPPAGTPQTASKPPVEGGAPRAPGSAQDIEPAEELP